MWLMPDLTEMMRFAHYSRCTDPELLAPTKSFHLHGSRSYIQLLGFLFRLGQQPALQVRSTGRPVAEIVPCVPQIGCRFPVVYENFVATASRVIASLSKGFVRRKNHLTNADASSGEGEIGARADYEYRSAFLPKS